VPAEGTGLALFDLRKIPVIDRQEERDRLWAALNMVHRTQQPTAMLLRGPAGSGKSRLADWIARRGHELGALQVLKATHSPKGGPRDGIGPMFARHFRCDGLPWSEGFERLQQHYESLGVERSACFHDAVGVTRMMGLPVDVEAPPGFQNPKEKHFALRRLLARLADRRPLLLWLDDVAWGWESARFAEFLLEETYRESLPVFVLMTARERAMEARPQVRQMVDRIREHEFGRDVPVDPLDRPAHRQLVERMLKLDDRLIEEIVERTEGNPLFAIQLVGDWVERGILEGSDGGFALRSDAERPIPDGPHDLWKRRITRVLAVLPEGERQQGLVAMQLAAALGRHIDTPEWRAVCRRAGVEAREKLVEELVEYGLARREGEGWSFVHTLLQESLERLARSQGRWARLHRICAGAIRALYPERVDRTAARRAEHLIEADDLDAALAPLLQAAQRARTMGAFREHGQWIERRGEVLDELGVDESDRRRVQNTFHRAYSALNTGDSERARQLLEETERAARQHGWVRELGDALRLKAQIFQDDGQIKRCLELVEEADRSYRQAHYFLGRAHCQTTKGRALVFRGDFDGAREAFGKAMSIFEALDYPNDVLRNEAWTTYTYIYQGEYRRSRGRARDVLERARELGDKNTEADAWNQLGEVARFEREWGEARRYYQRAAREYEQIGYRGVYIARMNMAMVEIPAGHYRRARREFAEVEQSLPEVGLRSRMPHVYAGLLGAAAGLEEWEAVDELLPRIEESYAANEGASKDTAWLAEHAARLSWKGGARGRAERLFRLARDIWAHLGDRERVEAIDRRIGQGGDGGAG
jgi:tetratricopeptide (TPR) repeat protein